MCVRGRVSMIYGCTVMLPTWGECFIPGCPVERVPDPSEVSGELLC